MIDANILKSLVATRIDELSIEEAAIESRLRFYRGFSHFAVLCGIVVPMLAGSTLVSNGGMLSDAADYIAFAVFVTGALTALHKGLNCEAYHAECMRSIHELRSLVEGYEAIITLSPDQTPEALDKLEARLQRYRERASDIPPARSRRLVEQMLRLPGAHQAQ
jgi:hypothetical protein